MHNMPYLLKNANKFYAQICNLNLKYAEIKYMQQPTKNVFFEYTKVCENTH